ncbi:Hypothetical protein Y17_1522 [Pectobacterium wasabiae CFBP 3304]|nr:Hypothetical protein Y17_1522 [Pectobacterium wasabiae CFBP 3304]
MIAIRFNSPRVPNRRKMYKTPHYYQSTFYFPIGHILRAEIHE